MVNAHELRKGNIVQYGIEKIFLIVETVSELGINGKFHEDEDMKAQGLGRGLTFIEYAFEDLDPVMLTPELLEKCGFEKKVAPSDITYYENNGLQLCWYEGKLERIEISRYNTTVYHPEYKYLHQIQNLYFALNLEELEINLSNA